MHAARAEEEIFSLNKVAHEFIIRICKIKNEIFRIKAQMGIEENFLLVKKPDARAERIESTRICNLCQLNVESSSKYINSYCVAAAECASRVAIKGFMQITRVRCFCAMPNEAHTIFFKIMSVTNVGALIKIK
jgi:hypothetical protein